MNDQSQLLLRSIKGPVIMITIGVLFAADKLTDYHFHETWPVLLIVIGLMQLLGGRRRRADFYPPPPPPPAPFAQAPPQPAQAPIIPAPIVPQSSPIEPQASEHREGTDETQESHS